VVSTIRDYKPREERRVGALLSTIIGCALECALVIAITLLIALKF
jgi:hypothetical protein